MFPHPYAQVLNLPRKYLIPLWTLHDVDMAASRL